MIIARLWHISYAHISYAHISHAHISHAHIIGSLGTSGYFAISSASPLLNDHLLSPVGIDGVR
jgi:hypothetical protein